ncbi:uncharacterized protein LOC126325855 isoform X2 [Schistocerca gregaria]|nr:uncharacterized protein LOC126325855 isoform X2 [Schistocerca gregaria]
MNNEPIMNSGVGVDIGGSMIKLVYFRPLEPVELPSYVMKEAIGLRLRRDSHLSINSKDLGGVIRFIKMPIGRADTFIKFVKDTKVFQFFGLHISQKLNATGGGAFKFEKKIKEELDININKLDEMEMLVSGLDFVLNHIENEVFTYSHEMRKQQFLSTAMSRPDDKPYLLVNIGSGVSILKITPEKTFQRVSGSSIGGGTFWGLLRKMTEITNWEEVKVLSSKGDNKNIDLLVGDIYGHGYDKLGLDSNVIASSFGKYGTRFDHDNPNFYPPFDVPVHWTSNIKKNSTSADQRDNNSPDSTAAYSSADIINSLLFMISNNIGQVAYLNAKLHQVKRVYFAGGFIQGNPFVWHTLSYAINFWSKGDMQAMFLTHDGYLGSLGALITPRQKREDRFKNAS